MRNRIHKILGVGITLVIALALVAGFALPAGAAVEKINEWYTFAYPEAGSAGDWFRQGSFADGERIDAIGPMAEAINGDLYVYVEFSLEGTFNVTSGTITLTYIDASNATIEGNLAGTATGTTGDFAATATMNINSGALVGTIGVTGTVTASTLTFTGCFHKTSGAFPIDPGTNTLTADTGTFTVTSGALTADVTITYYNTTELSPDWTLTLTNGNCGKHDIFKSTDGGRSWADTGYDEVEVCCGGRPGRVIDMVCSSIDEDILYVTDGNYVYKSIDGGDEFTFVARDSLEEALMEECGRAIIGYPITCIDAGYDDDDNPFVFIGTKQRVTRPSPPGGFFPATVLWIGEAGYPANWTDLDLSCYSTGDYGAYSVGVAPDFADSKKTFVVVSKGGTPIVPIWGAETHVVSTTGVTCSWTEFAELKQDCVNHFDIIAASRIGFPDDWEDTETLFVGVVDVPPPSTRFGGDVYMVMDGSALDMNVEGISTGCVGKVPATNIISLDVKGDTDEASLIAGAYDDYNGIDPWGARVYYSTDGGWSWDECDKEPTGNMLWNIRGVYVIFYEDTALAATSGCECAFSMSCGEEVGQYWNQISLIATDIDHVRHLGFSPGYVCEDSNTMFMLSWDYSACNSGQGDSSLFRYDGTYWERVFVGLPRSFSPFHRVYVSPDFNTTNCVYVINKDFEMWRSLDAGCSWDMLTFPCEPKPCVSAAVVIDEDTVIAGGRCDGEVYCENACGYVYKTTRHGARPWDEYEYYDYDDSGAWVISFALEPGYEDPGAVLLGDTESNVFISEDGGETWDMVGDLSEDVVDGDYDTWVIFDPGYATSNIIYAASGEFIARCIIDPDADWADQEWEVIYTIPECPGGAEFEAAGIAAVGDTALYVTDMEDVETETDGCPDYINGGVLRSLNPDADDAEDVVFESLTDGLVFENTDPGTMLHDIFLTCDTSDEGCAENVLWALDETWPHVDGSPPYDEWANVWVYEDTLAAPVVLAMPVEGQKLATTDKATLSWNELCGAECYEVSLYSYCAECPEEKLEIEICGDCEESEELTLDHATCYECVEDTCIVVDDLEPGTEYYWQVRVCYDQPKLSKWSEERSFMTALLPVPFADLCSPACGSQDIILTPNFAWGPVTGATGYDIELATTETFTAGVVRGSSTVNAWVASEPLEYSATYYWRVRAKKDGVYSAWTTCMFTTMGRPEAPPPPVTVEQVPPPQITVEVPVEQIAPNWIYAIIGIGAALVVVVIVLTVRTRRPPA